MDHYDAPKMKAGAESIRTELKKYTAAKEAIDATVADLRLRWEDTNHDQFVLKYNTLFIVKCQYFFGLENPDFKQK